MRRGASFLEIVAVVVIVTVAVLPLISSFTSATRAVEHSGSRIMATLLLGEVMERYRSCPFTDLRTWFGSHKSPSTDRLAEFVSRHNSLASAEDLKELENFKLEGEFDEQVPGQLAVLTFRCVFPPRRGSPAVTIRTSKVILDYSKVGWGNV